MGSYTPEMLEEACKRAPARVKKMSDDQLRSCAMTDCVESALAAAELYQREIAKTPDLFDLFGVKTWEK